MNAPLSVADMPGLPMCEMLAGIFWATPWGDARVAITGAEFDAMLAEVDVCLGHRARGPVPPLPRPVTPRRARPRPRVPMTPPAAHRDAAG